MEWEDCAVCIRGDSAISSEQLDALTKLGGRYGNGFVQATSGESWQLNGIGIDSVPEVLAGLCDIGLALSGIASFSVVKVTACMRAGSCPRERFNVTPYMRAVEAFLAYRGNSDVPSRWGKIAFSGCPSDCALGAVADLGFVAQAKDGVLGFSVRTGGGVGSQPVVGVQIEEFTRAEEVFEVIEAVARLAEESIDKTGACDNGLRDAVERIGVSEFVRGYQEHRANIRALAPQCGVLIVKGCPVFG